MNRKSLDLKTELPSDFDEDDEVMKRATAIYVDTLTPHGDMLTFARELQEMDAVVTIDNTLLHLAGSLGIKTFAMIAIPGYWAWPAEGQHCRWYDSVQIVRQPSPGNWMGVLDEIDTELEKLKRLLDRLHVLLVLSRKGS